MMPFLLPDDRVLVSFIPYIFKTPNVGDIIVFIKEGEKNIKRISKKINNKYFVTGDNEKDSKSFGWIYKDEIIGKLIYKF
jgi:signal peptidase I